MRTLSTAIAATLGLAAMGQAHGQEATPANSGASVSGLEEVVVTARRREETLQNVPIAVTAVSGDALREASILAVKDVAAISPGLNINSDSVGRAFISIRGVGTTLIDSVQPGVGIFFDGIYQPNTSYLNSPIVDVERIEVLRGPQGTLFGNNTLGGAINVITRKPTDEFRGEATIALADPDSYKTAALSLSGPIVPGKLQGRIAGSYHDQVGFLENVVAGGYANPLEQKSLHGELRWEPVESAEISFKAYHDEVTGGNTPYQWLDGPRDYSLDALTNVNNIAEYTYEGANVKGEFDLAAIDSTLTVMAAYDTRDVLVKVSDGDYGPVDFIRSSGKGDLKTTTGEIRLDTSFSDSLSTLFGVFASRSENDQRNVTRLVPLNVSVPGAVESTTDFLGIFGNVFWQFAETWELSAGLRFDSQEIDVSTATVKPYTADEWEPRVTLTKHWSPEVMTYGSVARGFRGGGQNGPGAPNPIYEGDTVWTYELGTKSLLFQDRLALNAAVFYNDYSDFIGQNALAPSTTGVGFVAINLNTGTVESYGLELEAHLQATDNFRVDGGLTLLHARITDDSQFVATTGYGLPSDKILFTPDWNYNLSGTYAVPVNHGRDAVEFTAGVIGKGARNGSGLALVDVGPIEMESYTLVNAALTYRFPTVDVALFATNLLDEEYLESYIDKSLLQSAGLGPLAHNVGLQGERRRVGLRATWKF